MIGAAPSAELVPGDPAPACRPSRPSRPPRPILPVLDAGSAIAARRATARAPPVCGARSPLSRTIRRFRPSGSSSTPTAAPSRFTADRSAFDRVDVMDDNGNGRPDVVDEALSGIARAQRLLVGQLELPNPGADRDRPGPSGIGRRGRLRPACRTAGATAHLARSDRRQGRLRP